MKLLIILLFLVAAVGHAQDSKNSTDGTNGEYGAVVSRIGTVRNSTAVFVGGRGGWIIDRTFAIGIGGYMLVNDVQARVPDTSGNHLFTMAYGGLEFEYSLFTSTSFRITFQELFGAGSISHEESPYLNHRQYHDPFLVFEPGLYAEIEVTKTFRIGAGVSHRAVLFLSSKLASNADLSSPTGFVSLKVGLF